MDDSKKEGSAKGSTVASSSTFMVSPTSVPNLVKNEDASAPGLNDPQQHGPVSALARSAAESADWTKLATALKTEHPLATASGGVPQVFLRPEASFKFTAEAEDEAFSIFHVESLLDQAVDLLDRSLRDRATADDLVGRYAALLLDLHEFKDLDAIQEEEEAAGVYEVPATEAKATMNADRVWSAAMSSAVFRLRNQETYFEERELKQYLEQVRRQAFGSGVPAYYLVGQGLGEYPTYTFVEPISQDVVFSTPPAPVHEFVSQAAEQIAAREATISYDAILDRRKEAQASQEAVNQRLVATEVRAEWEEKNRGFRRRRALVTRTLHEQRMRYATDADGALNYGKRILGLQARIHQDLRYAIARVNAAAQGLQNIYGYSAPLPGSANAGAVDSSIDEWLLWVRTAINWLVRFAHRDQDTVIPVSLRSVLGDNGYTAALKEGRGKFILPADILPQGRHVRLRGVSAGVSGGSATEHLWRLRLTAPPTASTNTSIVIVSRSTSQRRLQRISRALVRERWIQRGRYKRGRKRS